MITGLELYAACLLSVVVLLGVAVVLVLVLAWSVRVVPAGKRDTQEHQYIEVD